MIKNFLILITILALLSNISYSQNIDIEILREININRNKSLDGTFVAISKSLVPVVVGIPGGMLSAGLIMKDSAMIRNAVIIGASVVTSAIVTKIMKTSINRPRPYVTYPDIQKMNSGGSPSFPSGHTSGAFSLATSLSLEYQKWYVIVPSYAWASAVAYSRMDLGVHYPSDILMGAIVGAGSAYLCHYLNKKLFKNISIYK